jgi:hypothetical protein
MSADQPSSAKNPDAPVTATDRGADTCAAAGARGHDAAPARQPATALLRHDHAAAVLTGTPGRPRDASSGSASIPGHQQPGKPGLTSPEQHGPAKDAGTAGAKGQPDAPPRQPATGLLRHDHSAAVLSRTPGRQREAPSGSTSTSDNQQPVAAGPASPEHLGPAQAASVTTEGDLRPVGVEPQTVVAENGAHYQGRIGQSGSGADGRPPTEPRTRHQDTDNPGSDAVRTADGQPDPIGTDLGPTEPGSASERHAVTGRSGDVAPDSAGSGDNGDSGHDLSTKQGSEKGRKVYVDGHEIEVTGDAADGIWIKGLPGEVPDKIGDVLAGPEKTKGSRGDNLFHKAVEGAEDLYDGLEKNTSLGYDMFQHPGPTHAEVGVPGGHPTRDAQQHYAADMGGMATGILTVGILGVAAGHRLQDWIAQRARRAHDASN